MDEATAVEVENAQVANHRTLHLPARFQYLPLKYSKEEAVHWFLASGNHIPETPILTLSLIFSDAAVVQLLNTGDLETDMKHLGYKFWGDIHLNGDTSFEWNEFILP